MDYGSEISFPLCSLAAIGAESVITSDARQLKSAERIILPGVGAFGDAADKLRETGLVPTLLEEAGRGKPFLGICLGMQLLFTRGLEFGEHAGLGLIPGDVVSLSDALRARGSSLKVPQIGWNSLDIARSDCPILANTKQGGFVYYVHSFYAACDARYIAATSEYGVDVTGVVQNGSVFGTQFHPEKSGETGLGILRAFCALGEGGKC